MRSNKARSKKGSTFDFKLAAFILDHGKTRFVVGKYDVYERNLKQNTVRMKIS